MNTFTDTLEFSKRLDAAGFSKQQSETLATAFKHQEESLVASRELNDALEKLELRMKLWNGATMVAGISVLVAIRFFGYILGLSVQHFFQTIYVRVNRHFLFD